VIEALEVTTGEPFTVVLETPATAGFVWEVQLPEAGSAHIESLGFTWEPGSRESVGGPARQHFCFRSLGPGRAELAFVCRRPWENREIERRVIVVNST